MSFDVGLTVGALEVGILLGAVLMGAAMVQLYIYYTKDFKDPLWLRCLVSGPSFLLSIETI